MKLKTFGLLAFFLIPAIAHAHDMSGGSGFVSGLAHPVLGWDHLLAMISVGILSAQMGGRAIWTVPTTFVCFMLIGGIMGMNGIPLFSVEMGIAASVFALGLAIAAKGKLPTMLAIFAVGFFGLFHGQAHGMEMPHLAKPILYAAGFVVGTAGIHISGVGIGLFSRAIPYGIECLRYLGAGIAGVGLYLMVG